MFEKIHSFLIALPFVKGIYNQILSIVKTQFEKLQSTLSDRTYTHITGLIDKIAGICLILLSIYVIYSIFFFIYSLIVHKHLKIRVLISVLISLPFLIAIYVIYAYLNGV